MDEHNHNHHHEHEGHHHHADDGPDASANMDIASRSLSDALHLSFRILSLVMVFVLVLFLVSGVNCVNANEVAVIKVFGKVTGASGKQGGLVYTWPYPVGGIQRVGVGQRTLVVKDFWMYETAADMAETDLSKRKPLSDGLIPGIDGALFTGDRNLLHAEITCQYRIENPVAYLKLVAGSDPNAAYKENEDPVLDGMVRSAVCDAAIRLAATQTADNIVNTKGDEFVRQLKAGAQEEIDRLLPIGRDEIRVVTILAVSAQVSWPLRSRPYYVMAGAAGQAYKAKVSEAKGQAAQTLIGVAGPEYVKLVGSPWEAAASGGDTNLIGQYTEIRDKLSAAQQAQDDAHAKGDSAAAAANQAKFVRRYNEQAEAILARIDGLLVSNDITGQVASIISQARQDQARYISEVRDRENAFRSALTAYNDTPELFLERRWAQTRDAILQSDLLEKMYLTLGEGKTLFIINRDPKTVKEINNAALKANREQDKGEK